MHFKYSEGRRVGALPAEKNLCMALLRSDIIFYRLFIRRADFKLTREENKL